MDVEMMVDEMDSPGRQSSQFRAEFKADPTDEEKRQWGQLYVEYRTNADTLHQTMLDIPLSGTIFVEGQIEEENGVQTLHITVIRRITIGSAPIEELDGPLSIHGSRDLGPKSMRIFYPRQIREFEEETVPEELMDASLDYSDGQPQNIDTQGFPVTFYGHLSDAKGLKHGAVKQVEFAIDLEFYPVASASRAAYYYGPALTGDGFSQHDANNELYLRFQDNRTPPAQDLQQLKDDLIQAANRVWCHQGGVYFEENAQGADEESVTVTFRDTFAAGDAAGGGQAGDHTNGGRVVKFGTSEAEVELLEMYAQQNHYLLAHELGHVFGICHHTTAVKCSNRGGSLHSVMLPRVPNLAYNTTHNLKLVDDDGNPVSTKLRQHQTDEPETRTIGVAGTSTSSGLVDENTIKTIPIFHHIRNFPYDDGLHDFLDDWGKTSDVWNWCPDQGQMPQDSDEFLLEQPQVAPPSGFYHKDPVIGQENFIFVKMHAFQTINALNVAVHFFLAVPDPTDNQRLAVYRLPNLASPGPLLFEETITASTLPKPETPIRQSKGWTPPASVGNVANWAAASWIIAVSESEITLPAGLDWGLQELETAASQNILVSKQKLRQHVMIHKNIGVRRPRTDQIVAAPPIDPNT